MPHARSALHEALGRRCAVDARRQHLDPPPLGLVHQRVGRVEAHRLLVEQRAQELRARSAPAARWTGRPAARTPPSAPWGSRSPRSRRSGRTPARRDSRVGPALHRARPRTSPRRSASPPPSACGSSPAAAPRPRPAREAGERHRHLDHLVLEDDRAERVAQHRLERRVLVGHLVRRGPRAAPSCARCRGAPRRPGSAPAAPAPPARSGRRGSRAGCAAASASARGSRSGTRPSSRPPGSRS